MRQNIFIQSTINDEGQTFLEVGFKDGNWEAIRSKFSSSFLHNQIIIAVSKKDFNSLQKKFMITSNDALESLQNQFPEKIVNLFIGAKNCATIL